MSSASRERQRQRTSPPEPPFEAFASSACDFSPVNTHPSCRMRNRIASDTRPTRVVSQSPIILPSRKIRDADSELDRKRSGKRLAHGDGLAHLLLDQPLLAVDEFAHHPADRSAEAGKS